MDFVITAKDYANQTQRRLDNRPEHVKGLTEAAKNGNLISAGALTNENGEMIGSSVHVRFDNREELDAWLAKEPYIVNDVWETVEISTVNLIDVDKLKQS